MEERKNKQKERHEVAERKRKGEIIFQIDLRKSLDMGITKFKNEMDNHSHSHYSLMQALCSFPHNKRTRLSDRGNEEAPARRAFLSAGPRPTRSLK